MSQEEEKGSGSWLWLGILILALVFWFTRVGGHVYPWNEPGYRGSQAEPAMPGTYAAEAGPRYEPGSYGAFWENEERAARGVPGAVASPGFSLSKEELEKGQQRLQKEKEQESERQLQAQQAELDRLRRELEAIRRERQREGYGY